MPHIRLRVNADGAVLRITELTGTVELPFELTDVVAFDSTGVVQVTCSAAKSTNRRVRTWTTSVVKGTTLVATTPLVRSTLKYLLVVDPDTEQSRSLSLNATITSAVRGLMFDELEIYARSKDNDQDEDCTFNCATTETTELSPVQTITLWRIDTPVDKMHYFDYDGNRNAVTSDYAFDRRGRLAPRGDVDIFTTDGQVVKLSEPPRVALHKTNHNELLVHLGNNPAFMPMIIQNYDMCWPRYTCAIVSTLPTPVTVQVAIHDKWTDKLLRYVPVASRPSGATSS